MDVDRTIEHLLQLHAKADARAAKADARAAKHEARMDKFDRRINAMSKLMQVGMKALREQNTRINMVIEAQMATEQAHRKTELAMAELSKTMDGLAKSQKAYFDSLRKGRNGHK